MRFTKILLVIVLIIIVIAPIAMYFHVYAVDMPSYEGLSQARDEMFNDSNITINDQTPLSAADTLADKDEDIQRSTIIAMCVFVVVVATVSLVIIYKI